MPQNRYLDRGLLSSIEESRNRLSGIGLTLGDIQSLTSTPSLADFLGLQRVNRGSAAQAREQFEAASARARGDAFRTYKELKINTDLAKAQIDTGLLGLRANESQFGRELSYRRAEERRSARRGFFGNALKLGGAFALTALTGGAAAPIAAGALGSINAANQVGSQFIRSSMSPQSIGGFDPFSAGARDFLNTNPYG